MEYVIFTSVPVLLPGKLGGASSMGSERCSYFSLQHYYKGVSKDHARASAENWGLSIVRRPLLQMNALSEFPLCGSSDGAILTKETDL